jgi:serine phosphatase RsbU (regulator of sigma subunit)
MFGEAKLMEVLSNQRAHTATEIVADVLRAVRQHARDFPQSDDVTILAVSQSKAERSVGVPASAGGSV